MNTVSIKLVAAGDSSKISLLFALKGDRINDRYTPAIFENYTQGYEQDDVKYSIHLWDTPGQDEYDRLRPISYHESDVVLLCFALDDRQTLQNVNERWIIEVKLYCKDAKIILVGMNSDLRRIGNPNHVSDEEAKQFCIDNGLFEYIPCSARTMENINKIFPAVVRACQTKKKHGDCQLI